MAGAEQICTDTQRIDRIRVRTSAGSRPLEFGRGPILLSRTTPWTGPQLEVHPMVSTEVGALTGPPPGEHGLLVVLSGAVDIHQRDLRGQVIEARPGTACLLSGRYPRFVERIEGGAVAAAIRIEESHFHRVDLDGPPATFGLTVTGADPTVLGLVQAMVREIESGAANGSLFAESLSTALLSYLVRQLDSDASPAARGRLSAAQTKRVRDFIEANLPEDLTLSALSAEIHMSPRRFSEAFRHAFGSSPHQYILRRRIHAAMERLQSVDATLEQVAAEVGFSSASHLCRVFHRVTGSAPRRYARAHARHAGASNTSLPGGRAPGRSRRRGR